MTALTPYFSTAPRKVAFKRESHNYNSHAISRLKRSLLRLQLAASGLRRNNPLTHRQMLVIHCHTV
jgi:hypothetical protein